MKLKKRTWILITLLAAYLLFLSYVHIWGSGARMERQHVRNIKKIQPGMDTATAISIMGKADYTIRSFNNIKETAFIYETNDESDGNIRVTFDSTMHVTDTYVPSRLK